MFDPIKLVESNLPIRFLKEFVHNTSVASRIDTAKIKHLYEKTPLLKQLSEIVLGDFRKNNKASGREDFESSCEPLKNKCKTEEQLEEINLLIAEIKDYEPPQDTKIRLARLSDSLARYNHEQYVGQMEELSTKHGTPEQFEEATKNLSERNIRFDEIIQTTEEGFDPAVAAIDHYYSVKNGSRMTTGIGLLDRQNLHPARKTLLTFLAKPKDGKSFLLAALANANTHLGYKCLFLSLEMSEQKVREREWRRMLSTSEFSDTTKTATLHTSKKGELSDISFTESRTMRVGVSDDRAQEQKAMSKTLYDSFPHSLEITDKFMSKAKGQAIIDQIEQHIIQLQETTGVPDILIVDYLGLMVDRNNTQTRDAFELIVTGLRTLAVQYDLSVVTAVQANRSEGVGDKRLLGPEDVTEAFVAIMGTVDGCATITASEEMKKRNVLMVSPANSREVVDARSIVVAVNRDSNVISQDCAYATLGQVKRLMKEPDLMDQAN